MIKPFLDHLAGLQDSFELIIVDGGSADATHALVERSNGSFPVTPPPPFRTGRQERPDERGRNCSTETDTAFPSR